MQLTFPICHKKKSKRGEANKPNSSLLTHTHTQEIHLHLPRLPTPPTFFLFCQCFNFTVHLLHHWADREQKKGHRGKTEQRKVTLSAQLKRIRMNKVLLGFLSSAIFWESSQSEITYSYRVVYCFHTKHVSFHNWSIGALYEQITAHPHCSTSSWCALLLIFKQIPKFCCNFLQDEENIKNSIFLKNNQ